MDSGALVELSRLLSLQEHSEIQCHAAGTIRNLAAEEQHVVSCNPTPQGTQNFNYYYYFFKANN